jgi:hypothetical protein
MTNDEMTGSTHAPNQQARQQCGLLPVRVARISNHAST